jgi:hypothetical protein
MRTAFVTALVLCHVTTACAGKPLPEKAKLDAAKLVARDRYFKELKKADPEALKTFLDAADATNDDDARQAALYFIVSDAAAEGGNFTLALEALERLGRNFDYDVLAGKLKLLDSASKSTKNADARAKLVNRALELIDEAATAGRFDVAEEAAKLGESIATKLRDARLRKDLAGRRTKIESRRRENRAESDALARAEETLKNAPNDPEANRIVGIRLATEGNWAEALPRLALADDGDMRAAAKGEAALPDEPARQLALADAWWQIADGVENDKQRAALRARAVFWYSRSLAGLDGVPRNRASRRIKFSGDETVMAAVSQTSGDDNFADVVVAAGVTLRLMRIASAGNEKIKGFWLGQTEVTEGQWAAVMSGVASTKDLPKVFISFNDCRTMLEKLNAAPIGRRFHFRLPTAEEFAHACGKPTTYPGQLRDYAWLREDSPEKVKPVGGKKPNPFGLYDVVGNVWEFADDGRFYGLSAWDSEKAIHAVFTSTDLPANYTGNRADYLGSNLGVRIAADLR